MSDPSAPTVTLLIDNQRLRTASLGGTEFVAVEDFCGYLQDLSGRIADLTQRQQEHMSAMSTALDILCDMLGERFPDLEDKLLRAARARQRPV
jgi:hypothetical protein